MGLDLNFDAKMLESLVGGLSIMDMQRLNLQSLDQAIDFVKAYGFDLANESDEKRLWMYHRRAVTYIRENLMVPGENFPETLSDPGQLKNVAYLLIYASTRDPRPHSLQRWACATLKVMHVLVHLDNDMFTPFSQEIQDQIFKPIQSQIHTDPVSGVFLGSPSDPESIPLKKFDTKPFKSSFSSVTKLLAKPEEVAFRVLDKVGVRFVTKNLLDVFRVMRFLVRGSLVSFPHNIPDQSSNNLFPTDLFLEVMERFTSGSGLTADEVDTQLRDHLQRAGSQARFRRKANAFSSEDYRFVKFITRRLIRVQWDGNRQTGPQGTLNFFYPFEVQILDYDSFLKNLSGPASHENYKARQLRRARARVLGFASDEEAQKATGDE